MIYCRWRDTCEALVDAAPALLFDDIRPLLSEIRSLFRGSSGSAQLVAAPAGKAVRPGWRTDGACADGVGEGVLEEEALAVRLCLLQRDMLRFALALIKHARERVLEVHQGIELWDSSSVQWKEGRERLEEAAVACERVVSTSKEVLRVLGLSVEYRVPTSRGEEVLRALKAEGYVRLLPLDLEWEEVGNCRPEHGMEIQNEGLAKAVGKKKRFTRGELEELGMSAGSAGSWAQLSHDSFIQVDDRFYRPVIPASRAAQGRDPECSTRGGACAHGKGALVVLASMSMLNEVDDHCADDHCAKRVREMLGSSFSSDTASLESDNGQRRGHLVRIWLGHSCPSRPRAEWCEAGDALQHPAEGQDWREFVDELWGPKKGDAGRTNANVLYVDGLQALQEGWWGGWNGVVELDDQGDEAGKTATEPDEGAAAADEWTCVVTVDNCDNVDTEASDFEGKVQGERAVLRRHGKQANSQAIRKVLSSLRSRVAQLKCEADSVMGLFDHFWDLTFETEEMEGADGGSSGNDEKLPAAAGQHAMGVVQEGWASRVMRTFTREQQRVLYEALRGEAGSMKHNEWSFWISVCRVVASEKHLTSVQRTSGVGSQAALVWRGVEFLRNGGGLSEEDARLVQLVFDLVLLASKISVSRASARPMPLWATVRIWLISK